MPRAGWLLPALALVAACGGGGQDRLDLRTPRGSPPVERAAPSPPPAVGGRGGRRAVTAAERAVIRGWSDALRHGSVERASRYFAVPATVANGTAPIRLGTLAQVRFFNRTLPCGAVLLRTRRARHRYVVATFRLTERPGQGECGGGTGAQAQTAFLIRRGKIVAWLRVEEEPPVDGSSAS
jgi:hypothetical protein